MFRYLKQKCQQKIFLAHLKERLKLFSKSFYTFFVSCFVFEIFRPQTVRLSAILDLILPDEHDVTTGINSIKLHLEQQVCN